MAGWAVTWSAPSWTLHLPAWRRVPQYRARSGPDVARYNRMLVEAVVEVKPDVVWVEEPYFIYPDTLREIHRWTGATLVCAYSDDPRDPAKRSRHFDRSIGIYHVIFSTKDELLQRYFDVGSPYPAKFWKGYDPDRIHPVSLGEQEWETYGSTAAFIGHADMVRGKSMRLAPLEALARAVQGTKIWGQSWSRVTWPADLADVVHPHQLDGVRYSKAICAAKVVIQIPSRLARDTHSSRSLEIPACRTLMLAERTVDHQILFEEDKEAVFFGSISELVDKARYYVTHHEERERIAQAGYERCLRSGYSNWARMEQMLGIVETVRRGS
jgi:spore maturation protein CgeB